MASSVPKAPMAPAVALENLRQIADLDKQISEARTLLSNIERMPAVLAVAADLDALRLEPDAWRALDPAGRSFLDVDTPEELARAMVKPLSSVCAKTISEPLTVKISPALSVELTLL